MSPDDAKTPLNTAANNEAGENEDGENRIAPQEIEDDWVGHTPIHRLNLTHGR